MNFINFKIKLNLSIYHIIMNKLCGKLGWPWFVKSFLFIFVLFVAVFIGFLVYLIQFYFLSELGFNSIFSYNDFSWLIPNGNESDKAPILPSDPKTWWPTGVPQGLAPIGAALITFRALQNNVSPRMKVLAALGALGVSGTGILFHSILQQSVGFNRFAWGFNQYRLTGVWPSIERLNTQNESTVNSLADNLYNQAINDPESLKRYKEIAKELGNIKFTSSPGDDGNILSELVNKIVDSIMTQLGSFFKPAEIHGSLGDLLGQQFVIYTFLLIVVISISLIFISYLFNMFILLNKDKLINKFNNKFIKFYINYQSILIKISLIYLPIFIFAGLYILFTGLHFLITHQIPYEQLGISLDTPINSIAPYLKTKN